MRTNAHGHARPSHPELTSINAIPPETLHARFKDPQRKLFSEFVDLGKEKISITLQKITPGGVCTTICCKLCGMKTPAATFALVAILTLPGCTPLSAVTMAGSIVNRIMESSDTQPYINDARPVVNTDEVAVTNLNLGIEYMQLGKYEMALGRLQRAQEARPDYAPIYDVFGLLYQRLGQPKEAEQYFLQALKLDKDNPSTLNNYGQFLCSQDRVEEAEKQFMAAAENPLYDAREIPYANLGTCAYRHGQPDKAADYFTRALSLNPKIPSALFSLSEINYERKDFATARDYLNLYITFKGQSPGTLWLGIRIEHELGDKDKVSSHALLLRNKYPESEEAKLLNESGIR
jgi:type IV pilus assembly protein PilF